MRTTNDKALKEWAVIVDALDSGRQVILFRKGGIVEAGDEFQLEAEEFFLFPTYAHQHEHHLQPRYREELSRAIAARPQGDKVIIRNYAVIHATYKTDNLESLRALADHYLWAPEHIEERFKWRRGDRDLHALLLRVYRLPEPHIIGYLPSYRGCTSWVNLAQELSTAGAAPVLSDEEFALRAEAIKSLLGK